MINFKNILEESIRIGFDDDPDAEILNMGNTGFRGYHDISAEMTEGKSIKFRVKARQPKFKRYKKFKARAKERMGKKAETLRFKSTHIFDLKTKRYIKRKKVLTLAAMRKKARVFKKTMKRRNPNMR